MNRYSVFLNGVFMAVVKVPPGLGQRSKQFAIEKWRDNPVIGSTFEDKPYEGAITGPGFKITAKATRRKS